MHIFYFSVSILCLILLLLFAYVFGFLYFDGIYSEFKPNSRKNNKAIVCLLFYETVLIFCVNFLDSSNLISIMVIVYLLGSILNFYMIHMNSPFNSVIIARIWSYFQSINTWTAIMLAIARVIHYFYNINSIILSFVDNRKENISWHYLCMDYWFASTIFYYIF